MDAFIKAANGETYIGRVWPNEAAFIDWFSPNGAKFWKKGVQQLHDSLPFDGLWLDMNEASNFCDGVCY
jgi:alpha-glucosidase (family GH31 glycosyl hydrolase)